MVLSAKRMLRGGISGWHDGTVFPTPATTGPAAGTVLTTLAAGSPFAAATAGGDNTGWSVDAGGSWTVANGAVFDSLIIPFTLNLPGISAGTPLTGVTISNCEVSVSGGGGSSAVSARHTSGLIIEDCLISGVDPTANRAGYAVNSIYGDDVGLLIQRCGIFWCRIGVQFHAGTIQDCYINSLGYETDDHNECVFVTSPTTGPVLIQRNTIIDQFNQTAAIYMQQSLGPITNVTITGNLLGGGDYCIYGGYNGVRADTGCSTNSTTTVTDPAARATDLGAAITGTGIPAGTTVTAVTPGTGFTLSQAATATASGLTFSLTFGPTSDIVITGNRFSQMTGAKLGQYGAAAYFNTAGPGNLWAGNVIHDTGAPVDAPGTSSAVTFTETWAEFPAGSTGWVDLDVEGDWFVQFAGYGTMGIESDGGNVFGETPQLPSGGNSHAALLTSAYYFPGDINVTVAMKTVSQSRTPTPNAWERAWLLWNYRDNVHFYYFLLKSTGWEFGKEDPAYPGSQRFLATGSTPAYAAGNWDNVNIQQAGNVITITVDGTVLVNAFTDTERPYIGGRLGLYTEDAHVRFGNITIPGTATAPPAPVLYGITVDDITNISGIITAINALPYKPTVRVVFDVGETPSYYSSAISAIHATGATIMGLLLDSSDEAGITTAAFTTLVAGYLSAFGTLVHIWEVGNEINGNWTDSAGAPAGYPTVIAKLATAYDQCAALGYQTAVTLYANYYAGDGPGEASPEAFSSTWVPSRILNGVNYVLMSYYEQQSGNTRMPASEWATHFEAIRALYPSSWVGFGEIGLTTAASTAPEITLAESMMAYYYGLTPGLSYYIGGYFWWYWAEDCVPDTSTLFPYIVSAFGAEHTTLG